MFKSKVLTVGILALATMLLMSACSENPMNSQVLEKPNEIDSTVNLDDPDAPESIREPNPEPTVIVNLLVNPAAQDGKTGWTFYGNSGVVDVSSYDKEFYTRDKVDQRAYILQDVELPRQSQGKYLLLFGKGWVKGVVENSITRHPYLYGYQFDEYGYIVQYMQGQQLRHTAGADKWQNLFGVFPIDEDTRSIRFFLMQAYQNGDEPDGTTAKFDDLELIVFNTLVEAQRYIAKKTFVSPL
ncbi:MAG: hypothetical protein JXA92_06940 [candidate division Zixibacteria bacterium]|nr:hypothetical protein [candidate division Zixibacteria bacterium]